jgi:NADPH:quinone reductase
VPEPTPAAGQVLVDVAATAVNFADLLLIGGNYQNRPPLPFIPGRCPAGTIRAVGPDVESFVPGDRVLALVETGGFAEVAVAPVSRCIQLPDWIPFVDAAAMSSAYDTAWIALKDRARVADGETVLVLGASGAVGLASVQLAASLGSRVLAGLTNLEMRGLVEKAGAMGIVDLSRADLRESLREQVYELTHRAGANVILDPLGGDIFDAAIRALAWRGRMVVIGFATGRIPVLAANYVLVKNIEVSGIQVGDYRARKPEWVSQCFQQLFALYKAGKIKPPPTETRPLSKFADALRAVRDRTARGRIVLVRQSDA